MAGKATAFFSAVNLTKTIVGAGMLAIPYAFRNDGVLVGTLLTLLAALSSGFGLVVLGKCSKSLVDPRQASFFSLCSITYPNLSMLFDFSMFLQCYGVGLSYLVLLGDLFPTVLGGTRHAWILGSIVVIGPLTMIRQLDGLKYSSILGLVAIFYIVGLVVAIFFRDVLLTDNASQHRGDLSWISVYDGKGLISTFTILIFAFTGSMNIFSIINELRDNSMRNIGVVVWNSITVSCSIFLCVGICGYVTFGSNTVGNIILNYDPNSYWTMAAKLCLGTVVLLSFPLMFHPARISTNNMYYWLKLKYGKCEEHDARNNAHDHTGTPIALVVEDEEDRLLLGVENTYQSTANVPSVELNHSQEKSQAVPFPDKHFYVITAILLVTLYLLALNVTSFALVLALVGATGSTAISFTLPGLFGYKLIGSRAVMTGRLMSRSDTFYRYASLLLTVYGISVMCLSLYVTLKFGP
ncbi:LAMI_0E03708g1_1 [Lachancea mirantina]|uniref:LAMI_0E03708g1_1 n=1 Tax=Lachancea mirantina TaxID=1230905 RepID=A0A1G4JK11_9SACH|nr:LAMI_0E03708g1_1 [Lachancea mirantina]